MAFQNVHGHYAYLSKPPAKGVAQISREGLLRRPSRGLFRQIKGAAEIWEWLSSSTLQKKPQMRQFLGEMMHVLCQGRGFRETDPSLGGGLDFGL